MSERNILGLIASMKDELPKAEKRIAQSILDNPQEIIHYTASELGKDSQTSAATVIRLCKRLEVPSFTELKVMISRETIETQPKEYSDLSEEDNYSDLSEKLLGNTFLAMRDTVALVKEKNIREAAEYIQQADVVYVFGAGISSLIAQEFLHKWGRIGKKVVTTKDSHQLISNLVANRDKKAVFIGISNTGETRETVNLLEVANNHDIKTISISRFGKNSLAHKADLAIHHVRLNQTKMSSVSSSLLHAQLTVLDLIFFTYCEGSYETVFNQVDESRKVLKKFTQS